VRPAPPRDRRAHRPVPATLQLQVPRKVARKVARPPQASAPATLIRLQMHLHKVVHIQTHACVICISMRHGNAWLVSRPRLTRHTHSVNIVNVSSEPPHAYHAIDRCDLVAPYSSGRPSQLIALHRLHTHPAHCAQVPLLLQRQRHRQLQRQLPCHHQRSMRLPFLPAQTTQRVCSTVSSYPRLKTTLMPAVRHFHTF